VAKKKKSKTKPVAKKPAKKVGKKAAKKTGKKTAKKTAKKASTKVGPAKKATKPKKTAKKAVAAKKTKKATKVSAKPKKVATKKAAKPAKPAKAAPAKVEKKPAAAAAPAGHLPQVGDTAPNFCLPTDDGRVLSLGDFQGKKNVLLYFYPKDDTPGCTKEACTFQEHLPHFTSADTVIIGVSPDDIHSHSKFRVKYNLTFALGADTDNRVATDYGVWGEKSMYGRSFMGITRASFLINKHGKIAAVWPKVKVDGHSEEVQAAIAALGH